MYTPIYLFRKFALFFFFLTGLLLVVGGGLGFGGEMRNAAGQAGENRGALRTRRGKSWR